MKVLLVALLVLATITASAQVSQVNATQEQLKQQRLELARQYLLLAGIEAPSRLDVDHAAQLRAAMRAWALQPALAPNSATPVVTTVSGSQPISVSTLYPTVGQRFVRLLQLKTDLSQQPQSILIDGQPARNPDQVLYKFSLVGDLSQLFLSSSDLQSIYSSYRAAAPNNPSFADGPCRAPKSANADEEEDFVECLARLRGRDFLGRLGAATTLTLSYGQSPRVQQGILVPKESAAAAANHLFSGGFDFDPKALFPSGTDWSNAAKAMGVDKPSDSPNFKLLQRAIARHCGGDPLYSDECLKTVAGLPKVSAFAAAMVPAVSFKVQTQFDYFKSTGGQFIPAPFPQNHLWTLSFTNDLRKFVSTVGARGDAAAVLKNFRPEVNTGTCHLPDLPVAQADSLFSFNLDDEGQSSRFWELQDCTKQASNSYVAKKPACTVNGLSLSSSGVLAGFPTHAASTLKLKVRVSDGSGGTQTCEAALVVEPSLRVQSYDKIMLAYLEIVVSPDIVLNDAWYNGFRELAMKTLKPQSLPETVSASSQGAAPTVQIPGLN